MTLVDTQVTGLVVFVYMLLLFLFEKAVLDAILRWLATTGELKKLVGDREAVMKDMKEAEEAASKLDAVGQFTEYTLASRKLKAAQKAYNEVAAQCATIETRQFAKWSWFKFAPKVVVVFSVVFLYRGMDVAVLPFRIPDIGLLTSPIFKPVELVNTVNALTWTSMCSYTIQRFCALL